MNRRSLFKRLMAVSVAVALAPAVQAEAAPETCTLCVSGRPAYRDGLCVEHLCVQARLRGQSDLAQARAGAYQRGYDVAQARAESRAGLGTAALDETVYPVHVNQFIPLRMIEYSGLSHTHSLSGTSAMSHDAMSHDHTISVEPSTPIGTLQYWAGEDIPLGWRHAPEYEGRSIDSGGRLA